MGCTESKEEEEETATPPPPVWRSAGEEVGAPAPAWKAGNDRGGASPPAARQQQGNENGGIKKEGTMKVPQDAPRKGAKLLDKYVLGKVLGQGAFGVVYKCRKKGTQQDFAVKMIDQVETPLPEIEKEVQMLQVLKHPSVIKLHDVFYEKVFVCMVLELYKGGDMIQGMMGHWKRKGMIPMSAVRFLTKQMWDGLAFLHARSYVHRDIKGDNFMMDVPEVESPANRIYLSDFGTVCELKPGERKSQKCGTKNYWSPEFYKASYSYKVDCWAVGVIMFGFFSGKFPFKNEEEVKHKKLQIHTRVGEEGEALIKWAFARDEAKRCEAKEAASHAFISSKIFPQLAPLDVEFTPEIKETGANAGIVERRRELVDRLVRNARQQQQQQPQGEASPGPVGAKLSGQNRESSVHVTQLGQDTFSITYKDTERSATFQWTNIEKAGHHLAAVAQSRSLSGTINEDTTKQGVRRQLKNHDVKLDVFGKGTAKPLDEFIEEIQHGKARLLIDATRPKFLVRSVDTVCLRIFVKTSGGRKYLVETKETYPDGRERELFQLPGHKKAPHENVMQAAARLVRKMLNMQDCGVIFEFGHIDRQEDRVASPSYPVQSVYLKQTVTGVMTAKDPKLLQRVGFGGRTEGTFDVDDEAGYCRTYRWMTEAECLAKGIQLRAKVQDEDISALVPPPVGLDEDALTDYLIDNNVDLSLWDNGNAKSIADFSEELVKGESQLIRRENGSMVRMVDIVVLKIVKTSPDGDFILREIEEASGEQVGKLDRLPATKRRSDEHPFAAARRLISKYLHMDDNAVSIDPDDVKLVQEEQDSQSYPGIVSIYTKRFMSATMRSLPQEVAR